MNSTQINHHKCYYNRDKFCYVCSEYIPDPITTQRKSILSETNYANFFTCYGFEPTLRYTYKPTGICETCRSNLSYAVKGSRFLKWVKPTKWKLPRPNHDNCYVCKVDYNFNKSRNSIDKPIQTNIEPPVLNDGTYEIFYSAMECELYDDKDDFEVPETFSDLDDSDDEDQDPTFNQSSSSIDSKSALNSSESTKFNQVQIDSFVKLLGLNLAQAKIVASFFKKNKLTDDQFRVNYYDNCFVEIGDFFSKHDKNTVSLDDLEGMYNIHCIFIRVVN